MSRTAQFLTALIRAFLPSQKQQPQQQPQQQAQTVPGLQPVPRQYQEHSEGEDVGRFGASATVEVGPRRVGPVTLGYAPERDGDPDPGEVVWTWVPYEENDGRGKDRPVIIVADGRDGSFLAAQLTSKNHGGESDFVSLGSGPWDSAGRPSWANIDRIFRVFPGGMRREAASLDRERYELVAAALRRRYGWK